MYIDVSILYCGSNNLYFGTAVFEGRSIPCISAKGQQVFHSGYELRDKDIHDLSILDAISKS